MLKKILATTALVTFISAPAFAGNETNTSEKNFEKMFEETTSAKFEINERGFVTANENSIYASDLIGSYVYNGVGEEAESIGDVNDLIVTNDGSLRGIIVGVGGFLGIGEKNVAISTDELNWKTGPNGERWIVSEYSREDLEEAPEFEKIEADKTETGSVEQSN